MTQFHASISVFSLAVTALGSAATAVTDVLETSAASLGFFQAIIAEEAIKQYVERPHRKLKWTSTVK